MAAPLYDRLMAISEKEYPYHMPGHKRKMFPYLNDLLRLDFTEIEETDDLHCPTSYILEAEKMMAKLYSCDESFFLVNGTSGGILSAILSACPPGSGKKIIVANNCHISVYNALSLTDATPIYIEAEVTDMGIAGGIDPEKVDKLISENDDISACIITSPTYEGFVSDIKSIADKLHRKNIVFIVDEAHGAAFSLSKYLPKSSINLGADIVIQSWHKTMPVLTQTSVAHIKGRNANRKLFKHYLNVFQSTSPSFILMAVIDKCREYIEENGERLFSELDKNIKAFRDSVSSLEKIKTVTPDIIGKYAIYDMDTTRLTFMINSDTGGKEIDDIFYKKYSIRFEMCGINHITAITSIADSEEDIKRLSELIKKTDSEIRYKKIMNSVKIPCRKTVIPLNEVFSYETERVPFDMSAGRISAEYIIPYPPGIPILMLGEMITEEVINTAMSYKRANINLNGTKDNKLGFVECIRRKL